MQTPILALRLPNRPQIRALLSLALPVVVVQVGLMLMSVVDSIMVGRLSAEALAGVALANIYFFAVSIFGLGILMGLDPVITQAVGANDEDAVARSIQRGMVIALALTVPISLLLMLTGPALTLFRQPPSIVPVAHEYMLRVIPSVFPLLAFSVLRQVLQASGRLAALVWVTLAANVLNAALNWAFIYGHLGMPAMGANGSAWATTTSRTIMAIALLAFAGRELHGHLRRWQPKVLAIRPLARILALGAPVGMHMQLEFSIFGVVGLLMGQLGVAAVAGHQIALNLASLTFMVPMGVGTAATVLVGRAIGRNDMDGARAAARAALFVGVAFMVTTASLFLLFPRFFAMIYSRDAAVLAIGTALIPLAGVFQVFDGIQVVSAGILRGVADTRVPMFAGLVGFWVIGLPLSLLLAFRAGFGARGLWWGLVAGLAAVSVLLLLRVAVLLRRDIARVLVDDSDAGGAREV